MMKRRTRSRCPKEISLRMARPTEPVHKTARQSSAKPLRSQRMFARKGQVENIPMSGRRLKRRAGYVRAQLGHYHPIESGRARFPKTPHPIPLPIRWGVAFRPGEGNTCVTSAWLWCSVAACPCRRAGVSLPLMKTRLQKRFNRLAQTGSLW